MEMENEKQNENGGLTLAGSSSSSSSNASSDSEILDEIDDVAVICDIAKGNKCSRSWKILPEVGTDKEYPDLSLRDAEVMREINDKGN